MSEAAIRAEIKTILEAVSGTGVVHDYERFTRSLAAWLELMRDGDDVVNAWIFHRENTETDRDNMPTMARHHTYAMTHIREVDDSAASEKTLQAHVEDVFEAFRDKTTLNGTVLNSEPLQVEEIGMLELGKTAYHVVECVLVAHERVQYS